jgi:hypothetical protein
MFAITLEDGGLLERLTAAPEVLSRETTNWLVDMAMWIKADLKQRVPVKTGNLKNSIRYELNRSSTGGDATFHSVFYGKTLDEGVSPFTINSRGQRPPLVFAMGNDKVFANTVKHPGIKARNFTIETLEASEPEAGRQADAIAERIFKAVIG